MSTASHANLVTLTPLLPAGPDLVEALRFYRDELGFDVTWHEGNMAGVRRGNVTLNIVKNTNSTWADNASASIGVDDLEALYKEYGTAKAEVGPLEMKTWGRMEFHMILPSGVCLQFFQVRV